MTNPDWMKSATNAPASSKTKLPEAGAIKAATVASEKVKGTPGPKKSLVKRKVVGLNFSEQESKRLSDLEMQLKLAGIELPRGRSEAAEMAIQFLLMTLKSEDEYKTVPAIVFLESMQGCEDKFKAESIADSEKRMADLD